MSENESMYPMKWHKFLIYFSLWASAIFNAITAINCFSGNVYGGRKAAETVYRSFPGMQTVTTIYGVLLIAIAVFAIVTRFSLARYKATGPRQIIVLYVLSLVAAVGYTLLVSLVTRLPFDRLTNASTWVSLGVSVIMIFANSAYYEKRASLFVN